MFLKFLSHLLLLSTLTTPSILKPLDIRLAPASRAQFLTK